LRSEFFDSLNSAKTLKLSGKRGRRKDQDATAVKQK